MRILVAGAKYKVEVSKTASMAERFQLTGSNSGNLLIAFGLINRLEYDTVEQHDGQPVEYINENFDIVVIAAANFLFKSFDFGYFADFIEGLTIPVAIVGLGAQSNDLTADVQLLAGTERFIKVLAERCAVIGVRGDYTASVLARRGVHNVQVTGCPSYYADFGFRAPTREKLLPAHPALAVNASRDVLGHAFDREAMQATVAKLMALAVDKSALFVAQTERAEMVIAENYIADLQPFVEELYPLFDSTRHHGAAIKKWAISNCRVFWDIPSWIDAVKSLDFVIGTRFHGNLIALLAGVPGMVVCHDTRTLEMCEFLCVPHISMTDFNESSLRDVYARADLDRYNARRLELLKPYADFLKANGLTFRGNL